MVMNAFLRLLVLIMLPIACLQAQIPSYVPLDSLKGWYPFSGNANDISGLNQPGVINGASLETDRFSRSNSCYGFDGVNDNLSLGNWFDYPSFSISFWVKPDAQLGLATIIDNKQFGDSNWVCNAINDWKTNGYKFMNSPVFFLSKEGWSHVILEYANGQASVFVNGELKSQTISTLLYSLPTSLHIGYSEMDNGRYWKGKIDDIAIWNRALTQSEIRGLFISGIDTIPIIPTVKTVSTVSCFGGNDGIATVTHEGGIGPYAYAWNTNPAQTTQTATNLSAGTYSVTVKDSRDSIATATITITQPPAISNVIASVTKNVDCFGEAGGSVVVSNPTGGTPPYAYSWNTVPEKKSQTASDLKAGSYTVTVTDAKGCSAQSTVTITQPNSKVEVGSAIVENQVSCFGFSDGIISIPTPTGGTPPYTVVWNTQPVRYTERVVGVGAGTYTAVIVDAKGCIAETFISLGQPAEVVVESPKDTLVLIQTNAIFAAGTNNERTAYQWQTNLGTGFQNMQDIFQYLGTKTPVLNVLNCTLFNHNQPFRCIVTTDGCFDTTDIATLTIRTNVSVDEKDEIAGFNVSPNPTGESDQLQLRFSEISNQDITIELLDILGSIHYSNTLQAGSESCTIPVQGLSSGMYMIRVRMNNEVLVEKVIVN
jgi:Concanavalin A-like lectin/glucanases superfamily/Secretion system C-terminal sorting domain/SprB repeat